MRRNLLLVLLASLALFGCEGARNNSSWSGREEGSEVVPELKKATLVDSTAVHTDSAGTTQGNH